MATITQDKNGDLHLDLDPDEIPSNIPATDKEKQEIFNSLADFMGDMGNFLKDSNVR